MADVQSTDQSLLLQVKDLLTRKPNSYDVVFLVGPAKKEVKGVRILLEAASPVLEKKFELWDVAVVRRRSTSGRGIPLPEFDPEAFEMFIKLTMLDNWTAESLKNYNLLPDQIQNLISICRQLEMKKALVKLEDLMQNFFRAFIDFKDTPDFLIISHTNLQIILSSDNLKLNEVEIFACACRWAKSECERKHFEATADNLRLVLGDCLFEIRFPLMTPKEFVQCVEQYDILTPTEGYKILKFISNDESQEVNMDTSQFPFKAVSRATAFAVQSKLKAEVKPQFSTLCLAMNSPIVDSPPFVCDGSLKWNWVSTKKIIQVHGIGFLGPVYGDSTFDVTIEFQKWDAKKLTKTEKVEKCIFARKGKIFYIMLDEPFTFEESSVDKWSTCYSMRYYLKGPNTQSFQRTFGANGDCTKRDGENEFRFRWQSNQLAEILYSSI